MKRTGLIDIWYDRDISAGTDWEQQIKSHLNQAQIILLLVSPDFMSSDYCYGIEMQRALERHDLGEARVIPVIPRRVYWQEVLGKLQALPTDVRPVKSLPDLDEALYDVTEGIRKVIEEITPKSPPPSPVPTSQQVSQTPLPTNLAGTSQKTKEPWLEEGKKFFGLKQYSKALAACSQAILLDPKNDAAYYNKGQALLYLKRNEEALVAYDQSILLDPNSASAYTNKGDVLNKMNRNEEAQQAYEKARQLGLSGYSN